MKKIATVLIGAILCASGMAHFAYAADEDPHSQVYEIAYGTPEIDLVLDDCYKNSTEVTFNPDMGDAGGSAYFAWDEEKLYFYVHVEDKTPCTTTAATVVDHNTDSIEFIVSLYGFDPSADSIKAKDILDIGDAQFRIFRTKEAYECKDLVTNNLDYNAHGGFGFYTWAEESSYIVHDGGTEDGYTFEGYFNWGEELQTSDKPLGEGSVIGIGFQINDDTNDDGVRDAKIYNINANATGSMSTDRSTCGAFMLVKETVATEEPTPEVVEEPADVVEEAKTADTVAEPTAEEAVVIKETAADTTVVEDEPAKEEVTVAPQTFDVGIAAAVSAVVSLAGYAVSKKR